MRKTNIASSGYTAVQVGRIVSPSEDDEQEAPAEGPATKGRTVNVRSGNARVGKQADVIVGDLNIRM